jgi:hypothetical protein
VYPAYLPSYGTLMIDAGITNRRIPEPVAIQCAVHFVETEEGLRYCAKTKGEAVELPADRSLTAHATDREWTLAEAEPVPGADREAPQLGVALIPSSAGAPSGDGAAAAGGDLARRDRTDREPPNRASARTEGPAAEPDATHVEGGSPELREKLLVEQSGFSEVLESGQFEVRGTVYFNPLSPFQPDPEIPESGPEADDRLIAREPIRFDYS